MMNLNQLRIFYHAAKHMSFTKAAQELLITQPAVTNQIKAFEDCLNLKLFRKKPRKICITEEGKILYKYARKLFEFEEEIEEVIDDIKQLKVGVLSLGTVSTYARTFLPLLITRFHKFYPNIVLEIDEGGSLDIIENLLNFKNDMAIIAKVEDNPDICFIPFCREDLVVILPPGHRLKEKMVISVEDLADERIIMREKGSGTRKLISDLFKKHKFIPHILVEANNTELLKNMVHRGEGVSFMSRQAASTEINEKKLDAALFDDRSIFLEINIAYLKDHRLSPPTVAFLEIMEKLVSRDKPIEGISTMIANLLAHEK